MSNRDGVVVRGKARANSVPRGRRVYALDFLLPRPIGLVLDFHSSTTRTFSRLPARFL